MHGPRARCSHPRSDSRPARPPRKGAGRAGRPVHRMGAPVVPSRFRLTVNGRRQSARITSGMLSPAQPILIFSWTAPYPTGTYRFRVTVVARGGKTTAAEWVYRYR